MSAKRAEKRDQQHKSASKKKSAPRKTSDSPRHWIVVADHRQAHVYQKTPQGIERVPEEYLHCDLPLPGGEQDDELFLQDLAAWLEEAVEAGSFDRLAIIASPAALKSIHPLLDKKVHSCVCAALAKDVEKITENEIEDHLTEVVWF